MCKEITKKPSDFISVKDDSLTTTSLLVSQAFNRKHKDVLRKLNSIDCSEEFGRRNFTPSYYKNDQGKNQPCYELTREGFMFLVMGFTGEKAARIKEAYIMAFKKMEQELYGLPVLEHKPLTKAQLKKQKEQQVREIEERLTRLMGLFNPMSRPFNDVQGISLALRGKHPNHRLDMEGYVEVLPKDRGTVKRDNY